MDKDRITSRPGRAFRSTLLWPAVLACADAGDVGTGPTVRDSAGITIVENDHTKPRWTTPWLLSEEPALRIGSADGDEAQLLFRVTDARRLRDGRVLVVNSGSSEVRIYDADGLLDMTLGRSGEGPGEFQAPWQAYGLAGDSILVIDLYREIAIFSPDGSYVREFTPRMPEGVLAGEGAAPVDQFGDGSLLFRGQVPTDPTLQGVHRNRVPMLHVGLDGSMDIALGEFDDLTSHFGRPNRDYAFGARAMAAAAESTMWYGPGDRFELREVAFDGTLLKLVRLDRPARPVTESDRDRYRQDYAEQMAIWNPGRGDALWRQRAADALFPDSWPAHYQVETDPLGNIWVQDYRSLLSQTRVDRNWSVFDAGGAYLGDVVVPGGLNVHDIGEEHLIGMWTDDFGVEYVHLYNIEKPVG